MRTELISNLAKDKRFNEAAKKISKGSDYCDDLKQEVLVHLLELPEEKFNIIENLLFYSVRIMLNFYNSSTSQFYKKYQHHSKFIFDEDLANTLRELENDEYFDIDKIYEIVEEELNKLYWYDREVFKQYIQVGSYRELEAKTKINKMSLNITSRKVINHLKEKINKDLINDLLNN